MPILPKFMFARKKRIDKKAVEKQIEKEEAVVAKVKQEENPQLTLDKLINKKTQWFKFAQEAHVGKVHTFTHPMYGAGYQERTSNLALPKGVIEVRCIDDQNGYYHNVLFITYIDPVSSQQKYMTLNKDTLIILPTEEELANRKSDYIKQMKENLNKALYFREYVGADPELFVVDKDNKVIPAFKFLKSKEVNKNVYWDGFQAEFTVDPNVCLTQVMQNIQGRLRMLDSEAKAYNKDAKLSIATVIDTPVELFEGVEDKFVQFGCMPSKNVYGIKGHIVDGRVLEYRMSGGHIHFGCGTQTEEDTANIIRALDRCLGVACVSLFSGFDDPRRRRHYGVAGEYRTPPHGIEYRVLSNAWLSHPLIMNIVYDFARQAFKLGQHGLLDVWKSDDDETIRCINTCDVKLAREILERNKDIMIKMLNNYYQQAHAGSMPGPGIAEMIYDIFFKGMESVIEDPTDIYVNWGLDKQMYYHYPIQLFFQSDRKKIKSNGVFFNALPQQRY